MQSQSSQVLCGNQPTQEVSFNAFNSSYYQPIITLCLGISSFAGYPPNGHSLYSAALAGPKRCICLCYQTILIRKTC